MRRYKFTTSAAILGLVLLVAMSGSFAYDNDYAQDVQSPWGGSLSTDPSPRDRRTDSSVDQFGKGQTNSQIDNYVNQDEQINVDVKDGTIKVLRTNQKSLINDYEGYLIPLDYANPRELRGPFRTVTRKEGGDADVLQDKVKKKNYLWVSCPPWQMPYIAKAMKALDEPWVKENSYGSNLVYYKGKHRDVRDIMRVVGVYRTPDGIWDFDDANNAVVMEDQPCIQPLFMTGLEWVDIPPSVMSLEASIYEVDASNDLVVGIDWENWKNQLGQELFEFIFYDYGGDWLTLRPWLDWGRMRSYNIAATTAYLDFLQSRGKAKLLTKTVIAPKSGTVAEVNAIDQVASFNVTHAPQSVEFPMGTRDGFLSDSNGNIGLADLYASAMGADALNNLLAMDNYDIVSEMYQFLKHVAQVRTEVLAGIRVELEALSNGTARITRADLNGITVSLADVMGANSQMIFSGWRGRTVNYAQSGSVGVNLFVRPVVGLESAEVTVGLYVSDVNGYTPAGLPIIEQRMFMSNLEVKDGQPIVLGGVKRSATVESTSGIPYLVDIPWIGKYIFGRTVNTKRTKEIVVVLTPRFQLSCTDDASAPEEMQTLMNLAKGDDQVKVPMTSFGFDQWLLDKEFKW